MSETGDVSRWQGSGLIHVLLADDHPALRAGVRAILEKVPDIRVVGEASDGEEAQGLMDSLRPHVLLLDLRMPGIRAVKVATWVREHYPETAVLVLTAHDVSAYLAAMITAGVAGFVVKEEAPERIVEAVRRAAQGMVLFTKEQLARGHRWQKQVGIKWDSLTEREQEVLRLLVEGLGNQAIARELCVTTRTVEQHVTNLLGKLGVASRLEAAVWVRDHVPSEPWKPTR